MKKQRIFRRMGFFLLGMLLSGLPASLALAKEEVSLDQSKLPLGWKIHKTYEAPQKHLARFSQRLGGEVVDLKNITINAGGIPLQINIVRGRTEKDGQKIYQKLLSLRIYKLVCARRGSTAVEFISRDVSLIQKARSLLGFSPKKPRVYEVEMFVAPLSKAPPGEWNLLFNLLMSHHRGMSNDALQNKIKEMARKFQFGSHLALQNRQTPWGKVEYSLEVPSDTREKGDEIIFSLRGFPKTLGIPKVKIKAKIPVRPFSAYQPPQKPDTKTLTASTPFWPTKSPQVQALVKGLIKKGMSPRQRVQMLHLWVSQMIGPGRQVGTRFGVERVLQQKYGQCWDKSDVLITLCRAAGIPARQVGGWLYRSSGHIWAEVYIEGEGWISVDPTTSWLGTSEDYIPLFISEDGKVPLLYWDIPKIRIITF